MAGAVRGGARVAAHRESLWIGWNFSLRSLRMRTRLLPLPGAFSAGRLVAVAVTAVLILLGGAGLRAEDPKPIKILFLGDNGHHKPAERFRQLQPVLAKRGIDLVYTDKVEALNPKTLDSYDGLMIYANTTKISPEQEKALLDYVESGKGFIPIHCASYCFLNSPKYVDLVGAQFKSHGTGTFRTVVADAD